MAEPVRYLGVADFAARAGLSSRTVTQYGYEGRLPVPDVVITAGDRETSGWLPETVDYWLAHRPGRGARTDLRK